MSTLSDSTGDVTVSVRVTGLPGDRRYAVCLERPCHDVWVLDVADARHLHYHLARAIEAAERLEIDGEELSLGRNP